MQVTAPEQTTDGVRGEYARAVAASTEELAGLERLDSRVADWRLWSVLAAGLTAWLTWGQRLFPPWVLIVPLGVFVGLLIWHERVVRRRDRARRALAFYEAGLRRVEGRWAGTGNAGAQFADPKHPYAIDLDVFGRGSLFELLCTARTRAGEESLAAWLLAPAPPDTIHARQEAVAELRPRRDLRRDLALLGEDVRVGIDPAALAAWGAAPPRLPSSPWRVAAIVLTLGTLAGLALWATGHGYAPLIAFIIAGRLLEWRLGAGVKRVVQTVERPARDLRLMAALLARLEAEPFTAGLLKQLQALLAEPGGPASARVESLQAILGHLSARGNPLLAPVLAALLWTTHWAFAIETWRLRNGASLGEWLRVIGELEALCALSAFAYEHPDAPFPEIVPDGAVFEGEGLAHPLLPPGQAVPNDAALGGRSRLYLVSGSNMSGKSTFLRTIGANAVLGLAGAPVCARRLRLSPLHLGASIRTQDSLEGGISRFYAEILRLRQIVGIASETPPLLFLLDEILHGTNSHDRRVGASAVARALVRAGAVGLLTTHDLALAQLADDASLGATNVHFEDQLVDGQMSFDYRLRPGVVEKSNAIALMRAVGLDV